MKSDKNLTKMASVFVATVLLSGCDDRPQVASPDCVGVKQTSDPEKNKELLKTCPRAGQPFKPSEEKKW